MSQKSFSKIWILVVIVAIVAGGIFAWRYWQTLKQEEVRPEVEVLADWKTYRNEEYGYEVKYPESYKLIEKVGGVSFGYRYDLDIITNSEELTLLEYINRNIIQIDDARIGETILKKNISIAETDAIRFEGEIFGSEEGPWRYGIDVFWLRNKDIYRFSYSPGVIKEKVNSIEIAIFDQMLSTFRFIE